MRCEPSPWRFLIILTQTRFLDYPEPGIWTIVCLEYGQLLHEFSNTHEILKMLVYFSDIVC